MRGKGAWAGEEQPALVRRRWPESRAVIGNGRTLVVRVCAVREEPDELQLLRMLRAKLRGGGGRRKDRRQRLGVSGEREDSPDATADARADAEGGMRCFISVSPWTQDLQANHALWHTVVRRDVATHSCDIRDVEELAKREHRGRTKGPVEVGGQGCARQDPCLPNQNACVRHGGGVVAREVRAKSWEPPTGRKGTGRGLSRNARLGHISKHALHTMLLPHFLYP